VNWKT